MTLSASPQLLLGHAFAEALPELSIAWEAEQPPAPSLLVLNEPLAEQLGQSVEALRTDAGLGLLTGTVVPAGASPVAQLYAGHQFGGWSPRLGDGRALLLGEFTDPMGGTWDLHLKGSGRTPTSRGGDGLAAVGPMLREFLISEAMHGLGIPTTRSLAVVSTGQTVMRETPLPGAVLSRVASSHLRVGSFQYARAGEDLDLLQRLTEFAIARHYPSAAEAEVPALALFEAVVRAQATLIAQWMLVGFIHGVMNTDNMTISGETIDYGPCAFLEAFDPATVFSSIDDGGRYSYGNQPIAAQWNLARFAESLLPLIAEDQDEAIGLAVPVLETFGVINGATWAAGLRAKLGLVDLAPSDRGTADDLGNDLLKLLHRERVDFTGFFSALNGAAEGDREPARGLVVDLAAIDAWLERWTALRPVAAVMARANPVYIPRNHLVEEALAIATNGDLVPFEDLLEVVRLPFERRPGLERYEESAPDGLVGYQTFCGT